MPSRPAVVIFDVNETLSNMAPMAKRFADVGAPGELATVWFARVLRDGFALTAAKAHPMFSDIAAGVLQDLLAPRQLTCTVKQAVDHVLAGFSTLELHPDVADGVRRLRTSGLRLITLSNGSAAVAERLLSAAGIRDQFEALLSVEDAPAWKPARAAYDYAVSVCGTAPADALLVAVHPWDIDGAARAGLATAWLNRDNATYPGYFTPPALSVSTLPALADTEPFHGRRAER